MDTESFHNLLHRLHAELEHGQPIDDADRALLVEVLADIRQAIEAPQSVAPEQHASLMDRLRDATHHLQDSHPTLTSTASNLVQALSRLFQ